MRVAIILCSLAALLLVAPAAAGPLQQLQQQASASASATSPLESGRAALPALIDSSNVDSVWSLLAPSLPTAPKSSSCVAKCAKQLAACVFSCSRLSLGLGEEAGDSLALASSCKAQCGVAAARCGAKCIFHQPSGAVESAAPAVIDASNVAAVLASAEASPVAAGSLGGGKAKCLAKCGIASAACLATCKKATNPLLAYSEADTDGNLQMSCRAACLVHAAACAAECALGAGAEQSEGEGEAAAVALLTENLLSEEAEDTDLAMGPGPDADVDEAAAEAEAAAAPSQLGVDGVCLAKCGIKCAACVAVCPKKSSEPQAQLGFTLTCREKCAAKAAACAAICAIVP